MEAEILAQILDELQQLRKDVAFLRAREEHRYPGPTPAEQAALERNEIIERVRNGRPTNRS